MPTCWTPGISRLSTNRLNWSSDSHTSVTRIPSSSKAATWRTAPSGTSPSQFTTSRASSYCSGVTPVQRMLMTTCDIVSPPPRCANHPSRLASPFVNSRHPRGRITWTSEQLGESARRCRGAVGLHVPVVDLAPDLGGDRVRDQLGRRVVEVHAATGSVALEPVADVEVLLEVVAQREVEEGPLLGGQL